VTWHLMGITWHLPFDVDALYYHLLMACWGKLEKVIHFWGIFMAWGEVVPLFEVDIGV
jgi:hypothetical protein